MADQLDTEPGSKRPPPPRRGPSDRVLIALLTAAVTLLEGWRALVPSAQASPDSEVARRVGTVEASVIEMQKSLQLVVVDVAVLKAERGKK